jgi:hypothetical protein
MLLLELQPFLRNAFLQFDYETAVSALQATVTVSVVAYILYFHRLLFILKEPAHQAYI